MDGKGVHGGNGILEKSYTDWKIQEINKLLSRVQEGVPLIGAQVSHKESVGLEKTFEGLNSHREDITYPSYLRFWGTVSLHSLRQGNYTDGLSDFDVGERTSLSCVMTTMTSPISSSVTGLRTSFVKDLHHLLHI